jgi:plastocyanin
LEEIMKYAHCTTALLACALATCLMMGVTVAAGDRDPKTETVTIDNFSFSPKTLTIAAGTKVTWINRDDVPHTATSSKKPRQFDSGTLDTDDRFSHVFAQPGSYDYFCTVHPHMVGRIIVK